MSQYHITIDPIYKSRVEQLAKEFTGNNRSKLIEAMIDYFIHYQLNPLEREVNLDSKFASMERKLAKVNDTFVSFFRELEKKKIEPLITQSNESTMALLLFLKEQALTKDDLATLTGVKRKVALFENQEEPDKQEKQNKLATEESKNDTDTEIDSYRKKAQTALNIYKENFTQLIRSVSRTNDKGDYFLISSINEFKEKNSNVEKVKFVGEQTDQNYEIIEKIDTILRTADNYCDEFLNKGVTGTGKDKFFHVHTISEYKLKFQNLSII